MDTPPRLPPLDPSTYEWTQSARSPGQWRRSTLASEALWIPRVKEYHEMFICGSLTLDSLAPSSALIVTAKSAWRRLRFEVPELVASTGYGTGGKAYMQYQVPSSDEEVNQWIERTTSFECKERRLDFQELLESIRQKKEGHDSDQVFLLIHPVVEAGDDLVKQVDFILNADHLVVDGISIKILLDRFLALWAISLSSPPEEDFDWEESTKNLTPPWIDLMDEDQLRSGPEYESVAEANKDFMFQKMPLNPGLPLLSNPKTPTQKTHFITLTETQTFNLPKAIKSAISPESNITHLGHAAMVLALLRSHPPGPHSQTLYSPCWLNGRRYLKPFPGRPSPTKSYLPICQSFAPIIFDGLEELVLCRSASKVEVREKLVKACKAATEEYGKIRRRKSMLPECVVLFETLGKNMHLKQQQETSSKETLPLSPCQSFFPGSEECLWKDKHFNKVTSPITRTADPFFLSDGVTEQYISHSYFDNACSATCEKKKVFEVGEITFAANAEKNLIVRMSSWRGRITVSGEWKECDYDGQMIVGFLEDVVGIMVSLIDRN